MPPLLPRAPALLFASALLILAACSSQTVSTPDAPDAGSAIADDASTSLPPDAATAMPKDCSQCSKDATCAVVDGQAQCTCKPGYSGDGTVCFDIDECRTNNGGCAKDALCTNTEGSHSCRCKPGFSGNGVTCTDIDECAVAHGGCSNDAECINGEGSFSCVCHKGFTGDGRTCVDLNECVTNNGGCSPNATCMNTPGSRLCTCRSGWNGDGVTCTDLDECATNHGGCDVNAACLNTPGSRTCTCNKGFSGDGVTCADVNECAVNNGGCSANATCTNTTGSRTCACKAGFTGDGITCTDVNECLTNNGGCDPLVTCSNSPGSFSCGACPAGYTGTGSTSCMDIDECATNNGGCAPNAVCTNTAGSRTCACKPGFTGNGLTCTCGAAPTANAGTALTVPYGASFSLDASASSGSPAPLSFSWTGSSGAPPLFDPTLEKPSAVANDCGIFTYTVKVSNACGNSSTASVTVTVNGNGEYVSNSTCNSAHQCGTVQRPWCTISQGLSKAGAGPLKVAGVSSVPYQEVVSMRAGFDVLGGYEPTFTALRVTDPTKTPTVLLTTGSAFSFGPGVSATLDSFSVNVVRNPQTQLPTNATTFFVAGDADVTLANVLLSAGSPQTPLAGTTTALSLGAGSGGHLLLTNTTLGLLPASSSSTGISVATGSSGTVDLVDSTLQSGPGTTSVALSHLGTGKLTLLRSTVTAGEGKTSSTGIKAGATGYGGTSLTTSSVFGGSGLTAIAIDHGLGALEISGGTISGGGIGASKAATTGIRCDGTNPVTLTNVTVNGSTTGGTTQGDSAIAVDLKNTANVNGMAATVTGATITGGTLGYLRTGILTNGVPLTVTGSDVAAARVKGANTAVGVDVVGVFPIGSSVTLTKNSLLTGGAAANPSSYFGYQAVGVRVNTATSVTISDNTLVQGCTLPCEGFGIGVLLLSGGPHVISRNTKIVGGPGFQTYEDRAGIYISTASNPPAPVKAEVRDNGLIVGNEDPNNRGFKVYGITGQGMDLTLVNNHVLGGWGGITTNFGSRAAGLYLTKPTYFVGQQPWFNTLVAKDNVIGGGAGQDAYGASVSWTKSNIVRNVIDACGFPSVNGQIPTACAPGPAGYANGSHGFVAWGDSASLYADNFIFGGFTAGSIACQLGCYSSDCYGSEPLDMHFESNLCYAAGNPPSTNYGSSAYGLVLGTWWNQFGGETVIRNNVLDPGSTASQRSCFFTKGQGGVDISYNDFVMTPEQPGARACLVTNTANTGNCLKTAAEVNAMGTGTTTTVNNVSVAPSYAMPDERNPSVAGYHLDASCALKNLGAANPDVATDFDGDARGTGGNDLPEIGPDECR